MNGVSHSPGNSDRILERLLDLHPKLIDLSLGRIERLLADLGNPESRLPPVIHVAGTNGKGSTAAMLREGLRATGARVHAYTSPHLVRFHERIVLAGRRISEAALARLLEECEEANRGKPITFFEITTAAALLGFARTAADYCILEVGLGGRLDATNVVSSPALTAITRVGRDHEEHLGRTIEEIAREKAGILKPGVPCVVGPQLPVARRVIEQVADRLASPLLRHGCEWTCRKDGRTLRYSDSAGSLSVSAPALRGSFQVENAGIAIAALRRLDCEAGIEKAMRVRNWPARMQRIRRGPALSALPPGAEVWLDGGHNPDAGRALAEEMQWRKRRDGRPLTLIAGMLDSKDMRGFLQPFRGVADWVLAVDIPGQRPDCSKIRLVRAARNVRLRSDPCSTVETAAARIARFAPNSRVLICGSLYLAGEVLKTHG